MCDVVHQSGFARGGLALYPVDSVAAPQPFSEVGAIALFEDPLESVLLSSSDLDATVVNLGEREPFEQCRSPRFLARPLVAARVLSGI